MATSASPSRSRGRSWPGEAGPRRDVVLLNAAAALEVAGSAASLTEGLDIAARSIDSGAADAILHRWVAVSRAG